MRLRVRAFGLALGIIVGLGLFVAIFVSLLFGGGATFALINPLVGVWVTRSVPGAFLALISGFVYGFVAGTLVAWLYNQFCRALYKTEATK